jgi:hypothetical protein
MEFGTEVINGTVYHWVSLTKYQDTSIFKMAENTSARQQVMDWCLNYFGSQTDWAVQDQFKWFASYSQGIYFFKQPSDLTMFLIKWS